MNIRPVRNGFALVTAFALLVMLSPSLGEKQAQVGILSGSVECFQSVQSGDSGDEDRTTFMFHAGNAKIRLTDQNGELIAATDEGVRDAYERGALKIYTAGHDVLTQGTASVDQHFYTELVFGSSTVTRTHDAGQTFVAGETGLLDVVSLHLAREKDVDGTVKVEIYDLTGSETGGSVSLGTLLTTGQINLADIPSAPSLTAPVLMDITNWDTDAFVREGFEYSIFLRPGDDFSDDAELHWLTNNGYEDGNGFLYNEQTDTRDVIEADHKFVTYVQSDPAVLMVGSSPAAGSVAIDLERGSITFEKPISASVTVDYCALRESALEGGIIEGTVYSDTQQTTVERGLNVAVSINGRGVFNSGITDSQGQFRIHANYDDDDLITVFLEGQLEKSMTVTTGVRAANGPVDLHLGMLTVTSTDMENPMTSNSLATALRAGHGGIHPDIDAVCKVSEGDIALLDGIGFYVPERSSFTLEGNLFVGNMILEGLFHQEEYNLTVDGDYVQRSGEFYGGEGTIAFHDNFILRDGGFYGGAGDIVTHFDFLGTFHLEGGLFRAPSGMLTMRNDWVQTDADFEHNQGTVVFAGTTHSIDVDEQERFFNVVIHKNHNSNAIVSDDDSLIVLNELSLIDGDLDGGTVVALGAVRHESTFDGGNGHLSIQQALTFGGTQNSTDDQKAEKVREIFLAGGGRLPRVTLNAPKVTMHSPVDSTALTTIEGDFTVEDGTLAADTGNLHFRSEASFTQHGGIVTTGGGPITFEAPVVLEGGSFVAGDGDIFLTSSADFLGGNVTLDGTDMTISGDLTLTDATVSHVAGSLTLYGSTEIQGGNLTLHDGALNAYGPFTLHDGTVDGGNGTMRFADMLHIAGGTFTAPQGVLRIENDWVIDGGTFDHNLGTVSFEGSASNINFAKEETLYNVTLNKDFDASVFASGDVPVKIEGRLMMQSGDSRFDSLKVYGDVHISGLFGDGASTLIFVGDKNQKLTLEEPDVFKGNIVVDKDGGAVLVQSNLSLDSLQSLEVQRGVFDLTNRTFTLVTTKASATIQKNGVLRLEGGQSMDAFDFQEGSTVVYNKQAGPVTLHDFAYHNLTLTSDGNAEYRLPATGLTVQGDLTFEGGVLVVGNDEGITLGGSWLKRGGSFSPGEGTVTFAGTEHYVEGSNTFFNLSSDASADVISFQSNATQTVKGMLSFTGDSCNDLKVRSSQEGTQWKVNPTSATLNGIDLQDTRNNASAAIECTENCYDAGNNTNITFATSDCVAGQYECGNGVLEGNELCDDGNLVPGDGCSLSCEIENGYSCAGSPSVCGNICGDGMIIGEEQCDDANRSSNDGCSSTCTIESGYVCNGAPSSCAATCGDNILSEAEQCDDGNLDAGDGCSPICKAERGFVCTDDPQQCSSVCGDSIIAGDEQCDDGNAQDSDGCSTACVVESGYECRGEPSLCGPLCGDGVLLANEACDDGALTPGDGCSTSCTVERGYACTGTPSTCAVICGDGILASDEQCDDGNLDAGDGCNSDCNVESGYSCVEEPSVCEQQGNGGLLCSSYTRGDIIYNVCTTCGNNVCEAYEECQPSSCSGDACSNNCGDSYCPQDCQQDSNICGDGVCAGGESAYGCTSTPDDPNLCTGHVFCPQDCSQATDAVCGNKTVEGDEECDDGNRITGDGCSSTCRVEQSAQATAICGNGLIEQNEECDDGNLNDGDSCLNSCSKPFCGDAVTWKGQEECDPPSTEIFDRVSRTYRVCDASCQLGPPSRPQEPSGGTSHSPDDDEPVALHNAPTPDKPAASSDDEPSLPVIVVERSVCGNGTLETGEQCDHGALNGQTSCSTACTALRCGDGILTRAIGEQCDDGNVSNDDSCNNYCQPPDTAQATVTTSQRICGNGILNIGEQCDDGNTRSGDGCSRQCRIESELSEEVRRGSVCGDSVIEGNEQCDDGNSVEGDGCSDICFIEQPAPSETVVEEEEKLPEEFVSEVIVSANIRCGDSKIDVGEQCDDGNALSGDGCSRLCDLEQFVASSVICGNGALEQAEQCDDGNRQSGDGCSQFCQHEIPLQRDEANGAVEDVMIETPTSILIRFKHPLDPHSVRSARSIIVSGSPEVPIITSLLVERNMVKIVFMESLQPDHTYNVAIDLRSAEGGSISGEVAFVTPAFAPVVPRSSAPETVITDNAQEPLQVADIRPAMIKTVARVIPITNQGAPIGDTGPATAAVIAIGSALGLAVARRRKAL